MLEKLDNVIYLEEQKVEIEGIVFTGCDMWYDFSYGKNVTGESHEDVRMNWVQNSNDFKKIRRMETMEKFNEEIKKIKKNIKEADVIVSHVGPRWEFSPYKGEEKIHNSYYFFDGKQILENHSKKTWCFGHVHIELDEYKNGWRFISYGLGYPDEQKKRKFKKIII